MPINEMPETSPNWFVDKVLPTIAGAALLSAGLLFVQVQKLAEQVETQKEDIRLMKQDREKDAGSINTLTERVNNAVKLLDEQRQVKR